MSLPPAGDHVLAYRPEGEPLHTIYRDDHVRIVSDGPVAKDAAAALARRVDAAYEFDLRQQQLPDSGESERPLTVAVLSQAAFSRFTGDKTGSIAGVTTGPDLFVVPDRVLEKKNAMDEQTIAHELGHVQDFRAAGARLEKVPIYLQEGKEYLLGEAYPLSEGMANPHIDYVSNALAQVTAEDAEEVMDHFRTGRDEAMSGSFGFIGETVGALFVEYLRVQLGHDDAVPKVAEIISEVGRGQSYDAAFRKQFGIDPQRAEDSFVDFIAQTEGAPEERLGGTLFEPRRRAA